MGLNPDTTYHYRIAALNAEALWGWGDDRTFTTERILLPAPSLNGPGNGMTGIMTTPTFSWGSVAGATSYRIIVATSAADLPTDPTADTGGPSVVINTTSTTTSYTASPALNPGITYYWKVKARNAAQYGTWATSWSFTTVGTLLPAPSLSGPANGINGTLTTPTFSWGSVAGATSYRIIVATSAADLPTDPTADSGGPSVVINTTSTTASYTASPALNPGITYYWTVKARNAAQYGAWAASWSFTTAGSIGPTLALSTPNGGETYQAGTSLPISWTVSGNAAAVSSFRIAYTLDGGATWGVAQSYVSGSARSVNWTTPASASSSQCSLTILAFNAAGDVLHLDSSDGYFTISAPSTRPVARPDCNINAPGYGQSVQFYGNWAYVAPGLSIASYIWNFDDGTTSTARNPSHTFNPSATHTYTVRLTVTDSAGTPSDPRTLSITVTGQALGTPPTTSMSEDPVNLATGNFVYDHTDLTIPGIGFPFTFQRFYNSKDTGNVDGPMGAYWSHSYAARTSTSNGMVRVTFGDGRSEIYTNSAGVYLSEPGIYNTLSTNAIGTFVLTTKEQTRYNFNAQGRLASIEDKNSNTLNLAYNGAGALTSATNSAGRAIAFVNDASNRIIRIVDPVSRTNSFAYSAQGDLISATDPRGGVTRYGYDADHQMTNAVDPKGNQFVRNVYNLNRVVESQRDALGYTTTFTYDFSTRETIVTNALGHRQIHKHDDKLRVTQIMDEAGNLQNFEYDDFNNRTKVVDKNRRATTYTYDARGNVTSKTDPSGNVTTIGYDPLNNPTNRLDANLGRTVFSFDGRGNLTKTINPQNFTNTITYRTNGLPLLVRDANGNSLSNTFDSAGNLIFTRDALGYTRFYTYDAAGRKIAEVDPNNATNRFTFDGNNNLLSTVDPLGHTNVFAYDANNNQVLIQNARGNQTLKTYDPKDRLVSIRDALGGVTSNSYDALDRRITSTDPLGNVSRFSYDPVGNLVAVSNALGQVTRYTYDANGNQLTLVNTDGQTTTNEYDVLNRIVAVTDPLGHTTRYVYDELGRRTQVTDGNSQVTRMQYDPLGRLTNVIDAATGTVHFAYDKVGNRTGMTEPNGRTTVYTYDALNRLVQKQEPIGTYQYRFDGAGNRIGLTDAKGQSITNVFDANRRLTAVTYPNGSQVTFAYDANGNRIQMTDALGTTTYAYDALNRMTNCTDSVGMTVAYTYDANGNRVSMNYPGSRVVNYTFDALNRMTTVRDWLGGVTTNTYDLAGNLALVHSPNGTTARHTYDNAGRLISLTNALPNEGVIAAYTLTLDGAGNHLQSAQIDPIVPLIPTQTVTYTYDNDNRLTNATGTAFIYDTNGNMTAKGADTFAYDYENRLTNAVVGGITHQYRYDGVGNRFSATRGEVTTRYVLDVNGTLTHVLAEADAAGTITAYYVYGRGLVSRITSGGTVSYYHYDVRGSTVAITDSGGNITDSYAYDPFGTLINSAGSTANPFKYVGRYGVMDEGNGLAYIRARHYSPDLGRFVAKDPVTGKDGDSQSLNRYIYALNNPMSYVDVNGETPLLLTAGAGYIFGSLFGAVSTAVGDIVNSVSTRSLTISTRQEYAVSIVSSGVGGATAGLTLSPLAGAAAKNAAEQNLNGIIAYRNGQPVEQFDVTSYGVDITTSWLLSKIPFLKRPVGRPTENPITRYINGKNIEYYYGDKLIEVAIEESFTSVPASGSNVPRIPESEDAKRKPNQL
jgi:RHS repeat-associated protein